jgi:yecA family protein
MHDEWFDEIPVLDFDEIGNHLLEQGALVSPSQVHGCLCGLLSAGATFQPEYGLDALADVLDLVAYGELANRVMQLYTVSGAALRDEEFTFIPLLPDDEVDIVQRAEALADWCNGFLAGFAYEAASEDSASSTLSQPSSEALRDIAAFAQAEVDEDETDEDAEGHYTELVEYLRVAVINIFLDNRGEGAESHEDRPLH